jgi:Protein of unknown function (DUF3617)
MIQGAATGGTRGTRGTRGCGGGSGMTGSTMAMLCTLVLLIAAAGAEATEMVVEPGQWRVTSRTVLNGAATPVTEKARCLTPDQARDINGTFGPTMNTVNSTCKPAEYEAAGRTLKWRLECRGQLDIAIAGEFEFDSPTHYTATVSSKGWMAGSLISDVKTELEGERIGACDQ